MSENENVPASKRITPYQWRLIGVAAALLSVTVIAFFLLGVFNLLRSFVQTFSGVLWPLATAGVLALIFRPVVVFLQKRARFNRTWSIITLFIAAALALTGVLLLVIPVLVDQILLFIEYLPDIVGRISSSLAEAYPKVVDFISSRLGEENLARIQESISSGITNLLQHSEPALNNIVGFASKTIAIGTGLAIIPVYLFFMLESRRNLGNDLRSQLSFLREDWREDIIFLINEFIGSVVSFFRGQIVIAFIMGVLLAIGFLLVGLKFAIILGLTIGFLNVIPYLGSIIGLSIALPLAYFQKDGGGVNLLILATVVFAVVQVIEGYLLTPRIMGQTTGLHPMVIIIAIFFWGTALDGILGMILAIPLTAFFVVAWRLAKRKYLDQLHKRGSEAKQASS
ncbi:AI-2E family transporter [Pelagicoccus sp. SDUM812005]|uniref:AI-2E family transporter n=1 Tax=Pelagicoccus sp. SDUM812005 TaxID=3041257 RepID=UPI00280E6602|nr:AI-2E family transporter [Pelagicoccus sp. SDUM812005]MDQ8182424.1 AI-2E family transporter [Pelagicoccus sp. SDUM812005]